MKNKFGSSDWRILPTIAAALLIVAGRAYAQPDVYTLTGGNSIAQVNVNSSAGMFSWQMQDTPTTQRNYLNQQWFWYRVGSSGGESSINQISAASVTRLDPATITAQYTDSANRFNVSVKYSLTGGSFTSGVSDMSEQITINNTSGTTLDFHFFQYSDFNLSPSDSVFLNKNSHTFLYSGADQTGGTSTFSETTDTPGANHGEAGLYPGTLASLTDGAPTTLNDVQTATGNATWALEWDLQINPGGSALINKQKYLQGPFVPEPGCAALLGLGALVCAWRRRRA